MTLAVLRFAIFLVLGASLAPVADAEAQQPAKIHRIGFLRSGPPPPAWINGFREGLRELGYVDGRNIRIEFGLAAGADQLPQAAAELVRRNVDVIVASGTQPLSAARNATSAIPIVFVASVDPVATGVVESLARPGGNVTGFTGLHAELMGKRLELLREVVPGLSRVAILAYVGNPGNAGYVRQAELAAAPLGVRLQTVSAADAAEFERAFAETRNAGALIQLDDVAFTSHRTRLVELAERHRLPVVYANREFVDAGGLMAYGPSQPDQYRRAAGYVDKILKGARPADLPVQQPEKFELVVNLRSARAFGVEIPPAILSRADEVIE
jgi:putative ABC transport system substrate-binding protein